MRSMVVTSGNVDRSSRNCLANSARLSSRIVSVRIRFPGESYR